MDEKPAFDFTDTLIPKGAGRWNVIANITKNPRGGIEEGKTYYGTPVFSPGAKVYILHPFKGALTRAIVVGQNRKTKKLSSCVVGLTLLENLRAKVLYSPTVIEKLIKDDPGYLGKNFLFESEEKCRELLDEILTYREKIISKNW